MNVCAFAEILEQWPLTSVPPERIRKCRGQCVGFGWVFEIQSFCVGSIGGYKERGSVFFKNTFFFFFEKEKKKYYLSVCIFELHHGHVVPTFL